MDIQNKLIKIPINDNKEINVFIAILMSFYSSYCRELLLNKEEKNKNTLLFIIKKLLISYYNENEETINFFNIITPEILLLKMLSLTDNKLREKLIINKKLNIPITLLYNFYMYLNLVAFNIININNSLKFYCDTNNFYDYYYDKKTNKIKYKLNSNNDFEQLITNKLASTIEILMIQKENNTSEAKIVESLITDDVLNLENYHDINQIKNYEEKINFNNNNYILDSCIIKSNINDNYIILLHYEKNKYIYDINKNSLIKYDWIDLKKFKYENYDFKLSPSLTAIYIII
jgi:hypothetical protein